MTNGALSMLRTLVAGNVEVCLANPGTSEMHFVAALDQVEGLRPILVLFEGVATGAADGYARMTGRPASTLLHLGPGLANGLSNMHNALKASSPMINIVGEHASRHRRFDAPLTADIEGAARPFSNWIRTIGNASSVARDTQEAIAAAHAGQVATLILPADAAWGETDGKATPSATVTGLPKANPDNIVAAARLIKKGGKIAFLLSDTALREKPLKRAGQISATNNVRLIAAGFNARMERGEGITAVERLPYAVDLAVQALKGVEVLILIGSKAPVAFFAYPDKPSELTAPGCHIHTLARPGEDCEDALDALLDELGVDSAQKVQSTAYEPQPLPTGDITSEKLGSMLNTLVPEGAIVVDEALTTGRAFYQMTGNSRRHDLIQNLGGSIGYAMPVATGAAIACPGRRVICLESDGSGMYMPQTLWTQARENLDITTLVFANRAYRILEVELRNVGATAGSRVRDLIDIDRPELDWAGIARSMGVAAEKASTMDDVVRLFSSSLGRPGPFLIEVLL